MEVDAFISPVDSTLSLDTKVGFGIHFPSFFGNVFLFSEGGRNFGCNFLLTVGSFLLTVELSYLQLCLGAFFLLTAGAFLLTTLTVATFLLTMGYCV